MKIRIVIPTKYLVGFFIFLVFSVAGGIYINHYIRQPSVKVDSGDVLDRNHSSSNPASAEELSNVQKIAEEKGARAAYSYLLEQMAHNQTQGHDLAHLIGLLLYQQEGIKALSVCDSNFAFGCFHGFLGEMVHKEGESSLAAAQEACAGLGLPGPVASCVHGIGHGVMGYTEKVAPALMMCEKIPESQRIYCYDGAYMEYFTGIMKSSAKISVDYDNPWKFCLTMAEESQSQCVRNQILFMLSSSPNKVAAAVKSCEKLVVDLRSSCASSTGLFGTQRAKGDIQIAQTICSYFSSDSDRGICITGAAQELVFEKYPPETARQLCGSLGKEVRQPCLDAVERIIQNYDA